MSLYDPERDRVRIAGRWLRWAVPWVALPLLVGVFVSANVDLRSLPFVGPERMSAVLFLVLLLVAVLAPWLGRDTTDSRSETARPEGGWFPLLTR